MVLEDMFPSLNPLLVYRWPFDMLQRVLEFGARTVRRLFNLVIQFVTSIQDAYDQILIMPTRFCAKIGMLGDLILTPIALIWMFWPLHVPFHAGQLTLLFSAAPIAGYLCVRGYKLVQVNWRARK